MHEQRSWGFWTENKLEMLRSYLPQFLTASKGLPTWETVFIDAFAGEGIGLRRGTYEMIEGSPIIALEAGDDPYHFTKVRLVELSGRADTLQTELRERFPGRDIEVVRGDCNAAIREVLAELRAVRWAPTFAFLDPDGMELHWSTIEAVSDHKRGYRKTGSVKPEYLAEMFLLFPSHGLIRVLSADPEKVLPSHREKATAMFGDESWVEIHDLVIDGEIDQVDAREEYVNLMRWKIENQLGYAYTHPFEIRTSTAPIYHMIFATNNQAGTRIMQSIYDHAAARHPEMTKQAKDRRSGQLSMDVGAVAESSSYQYRPPWEPPGLEHWYEPPPM